MVNVSIVFICAVLDCGRIIRHPPIKSDSGAILGAGKVFTLSILTL
jgi:hypothetical protein